MMLHCGNCQQVYQPESGMLGHPDLEGIYLNIGGKRIEGTDINICKECAIKALAGQRPFTRKGVDIEIRKELINAARNKK